MIPAPKLFATLAQANWQRRLDEHPDVLNPLARHDWALDARIDAAAELLDDMHSMLRELLSRGRA